MRPQPNPLREFESARRRPEALQYGDRGCRCIISSRGPDTRNHHAAVVVATAC